MKHDRQFLTLLIIQAVFCLAAMGAIQIGDSKDKVIRDLGKPSAESSWGEQEILWYLDNYRIELNRGVVKSTRGSLHSIAPRNTSFGTFNLSYKTSSGWIVQLRQVIDSEKQIIYCSIPNSRFNGATIQTLNSNNATVVCLQMSNGVDYCVTSYSNQIHCYGMSPNQMNVNSSLSSDSRIWIGEDTDYSNDYTYAATSTNVFGCLWFPDGREYIGEFDRGVPNGYGITISNSPTIFRRIWCRNN